MNDAYVHGFCAMCNNPIRDGDDVVSIQRNVEHIETDGTITVKDSVVLASLCALCGPKYPEEKIRVVFGE